MSSAFSRNYSDGKMAFGQFMTPQYASDYISYVKARTLLKGTVPMQHYVYPYSLEMVNKTNLNYNLVTALDLAEVVVLQNNGPPSYTPTTVDPSANFSLEYFMDPEGQLFGNTSCCTNPFVRYMRFT